MRDETWCFISDVRDRKRTARGANNKVRGGGRTVKLPADYMTRKEREALNGEVTTYALDKPVSWEEYKEWPDEIQAKYMGGLIIKYNATCEAVGSMMGVHRQTIQTERRRLGIKTGHQCKLKEEEWNGFLRQGQADPEPEPETMQPDRLYDLIRALAGTGARLTIEVTL